MARVLSYLYPSRNADISRSEKHPVHAAFSNFFNFPYSYISVLRSLWSGHELWRNWCPRTREPRWRVTNAKLAPDFRRKKRRITFFPSLTSTTSIIFAVAKLLASLLPYTALRSIFEQKKLHFGLIANRVFEGASEGAECV